MLCGQLGTKTKVFGYFIYVFISRTVQSVMVVIKDLHKCEKKESKQKKKNEKGECDGSYKEKWKWKKKRIQTKKEKRKKSVMSYNEGP